MGLKSATTLTLYMKIYPYRHTVPSKVFSIQTKWFALRILRLMKNTFESNSLPLLTDLPLCRSFFADFAFHLKLPVGNPTFMFPITARTPKKMRRLKGVRHWFQSSDYLFIY